MNSPKNKWFALALVLAIALGYFAADKESPRPQGMLIRTYKVPATRAEEIKNVLNHTFATDRADGNAQVLGDGTLIVKGSEEYQKGISHLVSEISDQKLVLHTIHFDYWMVRGDASPTTNADHFPTLTPVLQSINKAQGSRKFSVLEHISSNSLDHREMRIGGAKAEVTNISKEVDGSIEISTEIHEARGSGSLRVNTQVKSGEVIILGENGVQNHDDKNTIDDENHAKEIYHIIRAEILP